MGEEITLSVRSLSHDGRGIASQDGYTLFIPLALPGEEVRVFITKRKKNYGEACLLEIKKEAQERRDPPCPYYGQCGGCQIQHMDYKAQIAFKKVKVIDALERIASLSNIPKPSFHETTPWHYRNKGTYHSSKDEKLGFLAPQSHQVVPHHQCLIQHREASLFKEELERENILTAKERCTLRTSSFSKEGMVILEREPILKKIKRTSLTGIYIRHKKGFYHFFGQETLPEKMGPLIYQLPPTVFFQINEKGREILLQQVNYLLNPGKDDILLDLYSGVGALSLPLGEKVKRIICIDLNQVSIKIGERHAREWGYHHATFMTKNLEKERLPLQRFKANLALLDPPRQGCPERLLKELIGSSIQRLVYVSCNPATLARDLKILKEGFLLDQLEVIDMFPQTYHVETVVLMSRVEK